MTYELLYAVINVIVNDLWPIPRQMTPQKMSHNTQRMPTNLYNYYTGS